MDARAGVVDQHVDGPVGLQAVAEQPLGILTPSDVAEADDGAPASLLDLRLDRSGTGLVAPPMTMSAPASASATANASPSPLVAPVTSATLPVRSNRAITPAIAFSSVARTPTEAFLFDVPAVSVWYDLHIHRA